MPLYVDQSTFSKGHGFEDAQTNVKRGVVEWNTRLGHADFRAVHPADGVAPR